MNRLAEKVTKDKQIEEALILGIVSAKNMGLEKPYDVAVSIKVALQSAGFDIYRKR